MTVEVGWEWPLVYFPAKVQLDVDPTVVDAEVARAGAAGEYTSPWRDWDDEEIARELAPPWPTTIGEHTVRVRLTEYIPPANWRVGYHVPRNIYKDDEPIAMVATPELAAEIVTLCNAALRIHGSSKETSWKDAP